MPAQVDLAALYAQAQQAIVTRDYDRASELLKQIVIADETYEDASKLLAQLVARKRWRWYNDVRLWGAVGMIVLIALGILIADRLTAMVKTHPTETPPSIIAQLPTATLPLTPTSVPRPTPVPFTWKRVSTGQEFARDGVTAIVVDPRDPEVLYAGLENAGVYKSLDGGISWQPSHNGLGAAGVGTLVIDPNTPSTLYAGIFQGGVYKTTDGGGYWRSVNQGIDYLHGWTEWQSRVVMDHQDSQHLYYTQGMDLYESKDGGVSWKQLKVSCPQLISNLVIDPTDPRILFAVDYGNPCKGGVYKSSDSGTTWSLTELQSDEIGLGRLLAIDSKVGNYVYTQKTLPDEYVYGSSDGGNTWRRLPQRDCKTLAIQPDNGPVAYCGSGNGYLNKTTDGGQKWQILGKIDTGVIRTLSFLPQARDTFFAGAQGLYVSKDGGSSWTKRSDGLGGSRLELKLNPTDNSSLSIQEGTCEHGGIGRLFRSSDESRSWGLVTEEGCGLAFDADGNTWYRSGLRSQDRGKTWVRTNKLGWDVQSVAAHPRQPKMLYAGVPPYIYISTDNGTTWQNTSGIKDMYDARLFFDHDQGQVVYAIGFIGTPYRSDNAGKTWTACGQTNIWHAPSDSRLVVDPRNSGWLVLATRGKGVLASQDGCKSWQSSNAGLGNLVVNTVAIDSKKPDTVYAGTDGGAYVSFNGGKNWGPVNNGLLGALVVYSIVLVPKDPIDVYAATPYGIFKLETQ